MIKNTTHIFPSIISIFLVLSLLIFPVIASEKPVLEFYYSSSCGSCKTAKAAVDSIYENYTDTATILYKEVSSNSTFYDEMKNLGLSYPVAIFNNETIIPKTNITIQYLDALFTEYLETHPPEAENNNELLLFGLTEEQTTYALVLVVCVIISILIGFAWMQSKKE